ncbi:MAG: hypothetical protein FWE55_02085 [Synergistaceae bacterium]|nr:hypothetical protein [Synergistaceae bacterium]
MSFAIGAGFLAAPAFAAPDGLMFEALQITDPQFGGALAATVSVPKGWTFEGGAIWNYQNFAEPAIVSFTIKSPADDAWFSFSGPNTAMFYFSQSPDAQNEAWQMGRPLVPPMKPEEVVKTLMESDNTIANLKIEKVDKLDGNAAVREKLCRDEMAKAGGGSVIQIEEAITYATFTKNGIPWEAQVYTFANYMYLNTIKGQVCGWHIGPVIAFQAHAGKLESYGGIVDSIFGNSKLDPVWVNAVQQTGAQIVKERMADDHQRKMAAIQAYSQVNSNRSSITSQSQSESLSNVSRGWTNTVTDRETWSDGSNKYTSPSGYDYAWSGGDGNTYYTNDSSFNPNYSTDFSGDWTPMEKTPW